ncbi:hypothetical protein K491DRAFT_672688 [Lophiostoma macrostomum CBS 122681]|uniref:DUF7730 domain-containing protein n=1 Tax=Lophiostoma macrostomum CBS 122681 TaxID=1314788 RepID=A0A6A6TUI5_9PLEO|nr:hypothetical protein K491DRAFT_672688 [Lophiostoma macrostomum CBS 122681]
MQSSLLGKVRRKLSRKPHQSEPASCSNSACTTPEEPAAAAAAERRSSTSSQLQCLLFGKLSAELRLLIYAYALGDPIRPMHIIPFKRGSPEVAHSRCYDMQSPLPSWQHHCFGQTGYSMQHHSSPLRVNDNILSLLLTCRIIYTEALTTLYSTNIFDFKGSRCFLTWSSHLPSTHLSAVRHIRISTVFYAPMRNWSGFAANTFPPENLDYWQSLCTQLAQLADLATLRSLRVEIIVKTDMPQGQDRAKLLADGELLPIFEPLKRIRLVDFVVETNTNIAEAMGELLGDVRFQVVGRAKPYNEKSFSY